MKKALSILLAVLLLMACVPLGALSVSADTYGTTGDCVWTLNGTHLTISGNGAMENFKMYGSDVPWGTDITSVTIEDGVTAIGNWAFFNCDALPSVTIGNSVTSIGDHAFSTCDSLTSVTMGDNVTTIGRNAFSHCTALISVTIPHSVTRINFGAFSYCDSLTSVTIPDSVTSIGNYAFSNCTSLTDVYYGGTRAQMLNVLVGDYNDHLYNATWHYNYTPGAESALGDANGDGAVNNRDVALLQQYINKWEVTLDMTAADANGDGAVNNRDVALLQQYINKWDVTLG